MNQSEASTVWYAGSRDGSSGKSFGMRPSRTNRAKDRRMVAASAVRPVARTESRERDHRVAAPVVEPGIAGDHGPTVGLPGDRAAHQEGVGGEREPRAHRSIVVAVDAGGPPQPGIPFACRSKGRLGWFRIVGFRGEDQGERCRGGDVRLDADRRPQVLHVGQAAIGLLGQADVVDPALLGRDAPARRQDPQRPGRRAVRRARGGVVVSFGHQRDEVQGDRPVRRPVDVHSGRTSCSTPRPSRSSSRCARRPGRS